MEQTPIRDGELIAAVDMGSNSFHMVVARMEHGEPRVIDRLRDTVRMAAGLHADGTLDASRRARALHCLARFGQRIAGLPSQRVRAIGTNSLRQMAHPDTFLTAAEAALGHPVEIAGPVLFLLSDDASFITGTDLPVDGGYNGLGPEGLGQNTKIAGSR